MSTVRADTVADAAGTGPSTLTGQIAPKAYTRFGSAGNIAGSFNVSSITDVGTGDADVNLTNAMTDTTSHVSHVTTEKTTSGLRLADVESQTASVASCFCFDTSFAASDPTAWHFSNNGDLA
jgi:hypothetical protein